MFQNFCKIQNILRDIYNKAYEEHHYQNLGQIQSEIKQCLEEFDEKWVAFEQLYVLELMFIEQDARRLIAEAIELERDLIVIEIREKTKGKILSELPEYNN